MNNMDKRIKELWIDALKSGEYKQTDSRLRRSTGYCCLGVLCDLHHKENPDDGYWRVHDEYDYMSYCCKEYEYISSTRLPRTVQKWAGLQYDNPVIQGTPLSNLNDNGKKFPEIADLIEQHL